MTQVDKNEADVDSDSCKQVTDLLNCLVKKSNETSNFLRLSLKF